MLRPRPARHFGQTAKTSRSKSLRRAPAHKINTPRSAALASAKGEGRLGSLIYGSPGSKIEIDDRLLAHLQLVIVTKLRRNEQFLFAWDHDEAYARGHTALWINPSIPLHFQYVGGKRPTLNRAWTEALMDAANSTGGLRAVPEPPER